MRASVILVLCVIVCSASAFILSSSATTTTSTTARPITSTASTTARPTTAATSTTVRPSTSTSATTTTASTTVRPTTTTASTTVRPTTSTTTTTTTGSATAPGTPIDQTTYNNLVRYTKFASAAYGSCTSVQGATVVLQIDINSTDTQGFIARDDTAKEFIVSFRGTTSSRDQTTDSDWTSTTYTDVANCTGCSVHHGFYSAWLSAESVVLSTLQSGLQSHAGYRVVVTGHSLGGAIVGFAALKIKASNFNTVAYSYGQPSISNGNTQFVNFFNSFFGPANMFRATHTNDGVPGSSAAAHYQTEFWQFADPSSVANVHKCAPTDQCNESQGGSGVNAAHQTYFGVQIGANC